MTNAIVCDVSASTLRALTLALSRSVYDLLNIVQAAAGPYMLSPVALSMQGYASFPTTVIDAFWFVWAYFRLPSMDGISLRTLDQLFKSKVPARQFRLQAARLEAGLDLSAGSGPKSETTSESVLESS